MGRTFEIRDPESAATSNQTYALYSITGTDVRKVKMTKGQASNYIDAAKNGKSRHIRMELSRLEGAEIKTKDVHRNYRNDPKPKGYKTGNGNGNGGGNGNDEAALLKFIKENPDVVKALLAEKPEPVKKAAAPKAKTQPKKKSVAKKAAPVESKEKPMATTHSSAKVDIEAALRLMETAIQNAVGE